MYTNECIYINKREKDRDIFKKLDLKLCRFKIFFQNIELLNILIMQSLYLPPPFIDCASGT
jgi:hypothetical protein